MISTHHSISHCFQVTPSPEELPPKVAFGESPLPGSTTGKGWGLAKPSGPGPSLGDGGKSGGMIWWWNGRFLYRLHPWSLTWNLKINPWKRRFLLETIIFRFHVKLWGCISYIAAFGLELRWFGSFMDRFVGNSLKTPMVELQVLLRRPEMVLWTCGAAWRFPAFRFGVEGLL